VETTREDSRPSFSAPAFAIDSENICGIGDIHNRLLVTKKEVLSLSLLKIGMAHFAVV
jgi:hypothetical protein